jgi:methylated-DNA-[protein]-cysteine S-methyltransferase
VVKWLETEPAPGWRLRLSAGERGLAAIHYLGGPHPCPAEGVCAPAEPLLTEAARQLAAYFLGELRQFDVPLELRGTPFQLRVWTALQRIPYGETRTYGQLAEMVECPRGSRAVGLANGQNPVGIIVPCHRVIAGTGKLQGYGWGLEAKRRLLDLEAGRARLSAF